MGSVGGMATTTTGGTTATGGAPAGAGGESTAGGTGGATGGAGGAAGAGGAVQVGGSGGAAGAAGAAAILTPTPTAGCQAPFPTDEPQTWLEHDITVANLPPDQVAEFGERRYWVRLPTDYDHTRLYPIVFYGPGCGAGNVEGTPMMAEISNDAIHVFLLQKDSCFSTGSYPTPDVPYFVQALDEVQAAYCTDASQVFVSGYSSGSWLSHDIACAVGDRIRGVGSASGGLTKSIVDGYACADGPKVAGILYIGENDDTNPAINLDDDGFNRGSMGARDRLIRINGCTPDPDGEPWVNNFGADYCTIWKAGCEQYPVVWCVGPGDGHGNGGPVSQQGFWEFWKSLSAP
jgi:hypothetical protein